MVDSHVDSNSAHNDSMSVARWSGELLFPCPLADAAIIDLSQVTALGTWTYAWFRARPHVAVTGANPTIRRQIMNAHLPVAWSDLPNLGVTPSERSALFGEN
jgi:hypothetical protein